MAELTKEQRNRAVLMRIRREFETRGVPCNVQFLQIRANDDAIRFELPDGTSSSDYCGDLVDDERYIQGRIDAFAGCHERTLEKAKAYIAATEAYKRGAR